MKKLFYVFVLLTICLLINVLKTQEVSEAKSYEDKKFTEKIEMDYIEKDLKVNKEKIKDSNITKKNRLNKQERLNEYINSLSVEELEEISKKIANNISMIEKDLKKRGTSVIEELEDEIQFYENKIIDKNFKAKDKMNLDETILQLRDNINNYTEYQQALEESRDSRFFPWLPIIPPIIPPIQFDAAVVAINAWFNSNDYNLSSELLTYAYNNDSLDIVYKPSNISAIKDTSTYLNIVDGEELFGGLRFENDGNAQQKDLYYAIHNFEYSKSESASVVVISDRYDFQFGDSSYGSGIPGAAVDTMALAQDAGVIVPFRVEITINTGRKTYSPKTENITIGERSRYEEYRVTLGKYEVKDYIVNFSYSWPRTLQTFGNTDAYIEIFDEGGIKIAYSDDGGYSRNAFVKMFFSRYEKYRIRVRMYGSNTGLTKLGITNQIYRNSYESLSTLETSKETFVHEKTAEIFKFTPKIRGTYIIETRRSGDYFDTYMFLIDPRNAMAIKEVGVNDKLNTDLYNDDKSWSDRYSKIEKRLAAGVPYQIIVTAYKPMEQSGSYHISARR